LLEVDRKADTKTIKKVTCKVNFRLTKKRHSNGTPIKTLGRTPLRSSSSFRRRTSVSLMTRSALGTTSTATRSSKARTFPK
jgi:hypothetical protein